MLDAQGTAAAPLVQVSNLKMYFPLYTGLLRRHPGDVKAALLKIFSNRVLPNGALGVFHPDNFSFGQPVYLSRLYAAAQAVDGVASVQITKLMRQGDNNNDAVDTGQLSLGRLEIARLDNDPDYPDHGVFTLIMKGGK